MGDRDNESGVSVTDAGLQRGGVLSVVKGEGC